MRSLAVLIATAALALAAVVGPLVFSCMEPTAQVQALPAMGEPDLVYKQGTMAIHLTDQPCGFQGIERLLEEEGIPPVHAYIMVQEGRPQVRGCWVRAAYDDEVLVQDMAGGDSFMPFSWFKPDVGV